MKFEIVGLNDSYGQHRYSNNYILRQLGEHSSPDESLLFVWWTEKIFLDDSYAEVVERLCEVSWFGVTHVPLLTPNWALFSQNNLAQLHQLKTWKAALRKCKGLIGLSKHLERQLRALYPNLNVFNLKHPMNFGDATFDYNAFSKNPRLLLVGAWLRDYEEFAEIDTPWEKEILLNHYAKRYLNECYSEYSPNIIEALRGIKQTDFLSNEDYDRLICSSLIFLGMHETSANNALCECISYSVPFVAKRHPAIIEYCGEDYPLLVDDGFDWNISFSEVLDAHYYLKASGHLRSDLAIDKFLHDFKGIYDSILS